MPISKEILGAFSLARYSPKTYQPLQNTNYESICMKYESMTCLMSDILAGNLVVALPALGIINCTKSF